MLVVGQPTVGNNMEQCVMVYQVSTVIFKDENGEERAGITDLINRIV